MTAHDLVRSLRDRGACFHWVEGRAKLFAPTALIDNATRGVLETSREQVRAVLADEYREAYRLVCEATAAIAAQWEAGTLDWVKNQQPHLWAKLQELEAQADAAVSACDAARAAHAANSYRRAWNYAVARFRSENNVKNRGNL